MTNRHSTHHKSSKLNVNKIALSCFVLGFSNSAISQPIECSNLTAQATYIEKTGTLCLRQIKVTNDTKTTYYKAALKLIASEGSNGFQLIDRAEIDSAFDKSTLTYSIASGVLTLPKIDILKTFGTKRYSTTLNLNVKTGLFELLSPIATYINPNYVPHETWKPYGMLEKKELSTVNLLGQSLPYAKLAQAIYSFDNIHIDKWQLIDQKSKDSGMQAGVYKNSETGEITLAFRGTTDGSDSGKKCDGFFNCLIDDIKAPFLDLISDISLVFGSDNAQFRHAFDYAQEVVNLYPKSTIVVTGHSLGGGLAQATGAAFGLKTFAFNSAPVPDSFFDSHPLNLTDEDRNNIHVISDIHDPVSNEKKSVNLYLNANHVTHPIEFNFDTREILPKSLSNLDDLRFNKHGIGKLVENSSALLTTYKEGW